MKTKAFIYVLIITMLALYNTSVETHASETEYNNGSPIIDHWCADVPNPYTWLADTIAYGFLDSDGNRSMSLYKDVFLTLSTPIYQQFGNSLAEQTGLTVMSSLWTTILNDEYQFSPFLLHEAVLLDFMNYITPDSGSGYSESQLNYSLFVSKMKALFSIAQTVEGTFQDSISNKTYNDIIGAFQPFGEDDAVKNAFVDYFFDLGLDQSLDSLADELHVLKSIERYSSIDSIKNVLESRRDFLARVQKVSNWNVLNLAIDNILEAIDEGEEDYLLGYKVDVDEPIINMLQSACSIAWNVATTNSPELAYIDLTKQGVDLLFNTSDIATNNIKLLIITAYDGIFRTMLSDALADYVSSGSEPEAVSFINSFETYLVWQAYCCDVAAESIESIYSGEDITGLGAWAGYSNAQKIENLKALHKSCFENRSIRIRLLEQIEDCREIYRVKYKDLFYQKYEINPEAGYESPIIMSGSCGENLNWTLNLDRTLTIYGTGNMTDYGKTINGSNGKYVYFSGSTPWYSFCDQIEKVVIRDGVTSIGSYAFNECVNIRQVDMTDEIVTIGDYAFKGCNGLASIELPGSLKDIGCGVFDSPNISRIEIPQNVSSFSVISSKSPFSECENLETVIFTDGRTEIPENALYNCSSVKRILLPENLTEIKQYAFRNTGISSIEIPETTKTIKQYSFFQCEDLESIVFHEGLERIEGWAFNGCNNLQSITLPESLMYLGNSVFTSPYIQTLIIPANMKVDSAASKSSPFSACKNLNSVVFTNGRSNIPSYFLYNCSSVREIVLPSALETIDPYAFSGTGITEITFPQSLRTINDNSLGDCTYLKDIYFNEGLETIGNYAFVNCDNISSIHLPSSLVNLGYSVFTSPNLTSINIPKSLLIASVSDSGIHDDVVGPLSECDNLETVIFEPGIIKIPSCLLLNCKSVTHIVLPDGVEHIGANAFSYTGINSINLPYSLKIIDDYAFYKCENIQSIVFPSQLEKIGDEAFYYCNKMIINSLPDSLQEIGYGALNSQFITEVNIPKDLNTFNTYRTYSNIISPFSECINLKKVVFENGRQIIPPYSLCNCTSVEQITIPDEVSEICSYAFYNTNIDEFSFPESLKYVDEYAFYGCNNLTYIKLPDGVERIESAAFLSCNNLVDFELPASLKSLGYSFISSPYITKVKIPKTLTDLTTSGNKYPFSECMNLNIIEFEYGSSSCLGVNNCSSVQKIFVPSTSLLNSTDIKGCSDAIIYCMSGSMAEMTAKSKNISHVSIPVDYRDSETSLPSNLTCIGDEAFMGCSFQSVKIPNSVYEIRENAFADCPFLEMIEIPESVVSISDNAFKNDDNIIIFCIKDSYAEEYALKHGFICVTCPTSNLFNRL